MASSDRRRGRPAQHLATIWRPYATIGPTDQAIDTVKDVTPPRTRQRCSHSLCLSLSHSSTAEAPSLLPSRALRAPRAFFLTSCHLSERHRDHLELRLPLHLLVARDRPEVSRISQVHRRLVRGRRDSNSGELHRCSIPTLFLPFESC